MSIWDDWMIEAACRKSDVDADWWFADVGTPAGRAAREVCQRCPVRVECRDYALRTRQRHGIWGGLGERERKRLQRQQKQRRTS